MTLSEMGQSLAVLSKRWPFPTRLRFPASATTVGTTQTELLSPNPNRVAWIIFNLAVNRGWLYWTPQVGTTLGFPIESDGDSWSADLDEDGELVVHPIYALLQAASGAMLAIEVLRDGPLGRAPV